MHKGTTPKCPTKKQIASQKYHSLIDNKPPDDNEMKVTIGPNDTASLIADNDSPGHDSAL